MVISPSSDPHQSGSDRQATVLVVDDDPTLQTMILDYFVDNNIETLLASGREEMLRQLSTQEVNVVILDLRLGRRGWARRAAGAPVEFRCAGYYNYRPPPG